VSNTKEEENKPKKVIRRRKSGPNDANDPEKEKARKLRMYFNEKTEAAIVAFQQSTDKREQSRLYTTEILPAFEKLTENLINIYKFSSLHDSFDDLKSDCVNFLFETIRKWDKSRGKPAFSYFNVVAKHCLIIKTKQKSLRIKRNVSLDDHDALTSNEHKLIEEHCIVQNYDSNVENISVAQNMISMLYEIRSKVKTENELVCINSIITIFENIDEIDLLNKSAILLYMRELSGLSPKQLTTTLQSIKKLYRRYKLDPRYDIF
jgi:hypothetical protein